MDTSRQSEVLLETTTSPTSSAVHPQGCGQRSEQGIRPLAALATKAGRNSLSQRRTRLRIVPRPVSHPRAEQHEPDDPPWQPAQTQQPRVTSKDRRENDRSVGAHDSFRRSAHEPEDPAPLDACDKLVNTYALDRGIMTLNH